MVSDLFVIAAAWFIGAFINGLTGMGGTLIALPLITLFVSSKSVILISFIASIMVSLLTLILYWRYIDFRDVLGFWLPAIPGIFIGVWTLKIVDIELLDLLLCVIIVLHIVVQLIQDWLGTCMAPRAVMKYVCGFIAGFFGGSIGINGPIMAMYASLMCLEKNKARGFFTSSTATSTAPVSPLPRSTPNTPTLRNIQLSSGFTSNSSSLAIISIRLPQKRAMTTNTGSMAEM